jgi:two-component system, OmpR family, alkaline phosphatase synthesis response regulator PhoP
MTAVQTGRKILVVEDDADIAQLLRIHLKDLGYGVDLCFDGASGLQRALAGDYALVVLDLMLPRLDGYEVCKRIREKNKRLPILILTLKSEIIDKILGLELGADDYITKPFSIQELIARVKALVRRTRLHEEGAGEGAPQELRIGELVISADKRKVSVAGKEVDLTRKQFDILYFLARSPGRPYPREELLSRIWGYESSGYEHTVDTHINRVRAKIEPDPSSPRYILTVWGVGYRFAEASELKKSPA